MNSPGSAAPSDTRDGFTVLLEALEHHGCNPRKVGSQYAARCPAHDDRIPSLTFAPATKRSGAAVLHCQTGCTPDAVLDALELTAAERELILRGHGEAKRAPSPASDAERLEHTYHDAEGKPIARKVRLTLGGMTTKLASGVKALWWEYPYGDDWLTPSKFPKDAPPPQAPRVLYRLPEVLAAKRHGRTVYIPEGEKCCDALAELGLTATTNPAGASRNGQAPKWTPAHAEQLRGAKAVRIFAYDDGPGLAHAEAVARTCHDVGVADVRVIQLKGQRTPDGRTGGGDVADWVWERHGRPGLRAELEQLAEAAPLWTPAALDETTKPSTDTDAPARQRPSIRLRNELAPVTDEAEAALLADPDAGIYVRARLLVRIVRDTGERRHGLVREPDSPVIQPLPLDALRERIDRAAAWVRWDKREKQEHSTLPPEWVARTLAARGAWRFPYLEGVIEAPTLKPNGELLDAPGYDADSGLMLIPSGRFPAIPARPTRHDVLAAVARLLEPFADFPFLDTATDLPATIAAVLSLVGRDAIDGCVPLFAVRAPTPGTGKGLLADVVCLIGTGRSAARMSMPGDDGEVKKVILTVAIEGSPVVLLDNVDGALGSQSLASALTAAAWKDRVLGLSVDWHGPLRTVWIATGNGLTFRGDLARRVLPIDLDAQQEHPEDRPESTFTHPDLLDWTRQHRPQLVADALTVLRAYHVAERPKHGGARKGSFEAWDDLVRGACVWVGLGDPCAGTERVRREDDSDLSALGAALEAWRETFHDTSKTAAEAVAAAGEGTDLRDALLTLTGRDKLEPRFLGYALRKVKGRIVGGLRFNREDGGRFRRWRVMG